MKKHDNTLYVTTQKSYLACEGTNVVVRVEKKTRLRLPIHTIGSIVCFGNVSCSPFLMGLCSKAGVSIAFLTEYGRFLARVVGAQSGNVLLRRHQHRLTADPEQAASIARNIVTAKIANARVSLMRSVRDHGAKLNAEAVSSAARKLARSIEELQRPLSLERVRGVEGDAAKVYFSVFDALIVAQKDTFFFRGRSRRPPTDAMNALLSFIYTLLASDLTSACESVGLDPQMGFLHADRPGRASLALDLMEVFRPAFADRLALTLVNRQQLNDKGFRTRETGGVEMNDETRKTLLVAYQKRKQETIVHPFLEEEMPIGLLFHIQARLLARFLRGDLDAYPPFFWK